MRLLQPLPREGKTSKKKNLKNCLAEIHTLEVWPIHRNVAGSRFAETLSTDCSLPLFVGHAKGRNVLCPIAKFAKRGHNLFLPKMRMISARQLNHRNSKRKVCSIKKTSVFFGRTAHFIYLCVNNKSCLKRQQIKEVRGI
ncbi:hypothetical protein HMPREF9431_01559 [Segatella oulorum F0390]|uniref:Uncharacterized protein n=1 Tax=Segatella oulorum F0390 TaxID=702438 RepID=G1WCK8_9BACT|nr:hypothetical protein HMPREF9431_01559 [Segatella oulorum F0390]